jgi:hypothetical protein
MVAVDRLAAALVRLRQQRGRRRRRLDAHRRMRAVAAVAGHARAHDERGPRDGEEHRRGGDQHDAEPVRLAVRRLDLAPQLRRYIPTIHGPHLSSAIAGRALASSGGRETDMSDTIG